MYGRPDRSALQLYIAYAKPASLRLSVSYGKWMPTVNRRQSPRRGFDCEPQLERTKHKKGSVVENKRLFLPVPGEHSGPRDCSVAERARSIYTCTARYYDTIPRVRRRGLIRSCRCNLTGPRGGISNHGTRQYRRDDNRREKSAAIRAIR